MFLVLAVIPLLSITLHRSCRLPQPTTLLIYSMLPKFSLPGNKLASKHPHSTTAAISKKARRRRCRRRCKWGLRPPPARRLQTGAWTCPACPRCTWPSSGGTGCRCSSRTGQGTAMASACTSFAS